ncbi:BadF/BadG/BcrA/BcrD ATPase family protein [Paraglaciecola sp.]|uniref:N-acetylglucosamine kinase n=1 Tax=Paraglaciecola sp. TaxID=1920173 RepID=UPI003263CC83
MFLGVDGGGTKTAFVLIDKNGHILAEHSEPTCYHIQVGLDGARNVIESGISKTLHLAKKNVNDLTYAFFGLPAFGEDSEVDNHISELPSSILSAKQYQCDNDMVNGWAAAFGGQDGINIVAGTGSIAYGVRKNQRARCGGWGELFSDEGSAYWVAINGLRAFSQMSDGRLKKGPLYEVIKQDLAIGQDLDITGLVLSKWQGERSRIAAVSTLVSKAAGLGDYEALRIMEEAGKELAKIVLSTREVLGFTENEHVNLSFSGGVFRSGSLVSKPMKEALNQTTLRFSISSPLYSPVIGSALYAMHLSGETASKSCLHKLQNL